ncbi:MAG: DinB family protein [Mycobacterium sp.]
MSNPTTASNPTASNDANAVLLRQFDLVWSLAEIHLNDLTEDDLWFEPSDTVWTVRRGHDGRWRPDWADVEPDPIPVPTIAWLTWHISWWWTVALDHAHGATPREREQVFWAGRASSAVAQLHQMRWQWRGVLTGGCNLDQICAYPWGVNAGRSFADTVAWVNFELTKNVAEIGQLRLLRASRSSPRQ